MGIQEEFEKHKESVKTLPEEPSDLDKLTLYGLYKQATQGPVSIPRPNRFDSIGRYKWDAWKSFEEKSKDEAMSDYVAKVKELHAAAIAAAAETS